MKNIKLVVADNDGTLIPDDPHTMTDYCREVIKKLQSQGIYFGMASGRDVKQGLQMAQSFGIDLDLFVGLNGSEYYDGIEDKYYQNCILKKECIQDIITKMLDHFPHLNLNPAIYIDEHRLSLRDEIVKFGNHNVSMNSILVKSLDEFWQKDCGKVMFRVDEDIMAIIYPYALSISNDKYYATKTQTTMLEFCPTEAKKINPIIKFCQNHNIDMSEVSCFGDMTNDNDMIEGCGYGVAMLNADEETKKVAKAITYKNNNEDGFADFVEKNFLNH